MVFGKITANSQIYAMISICEDATCLSVNPHKLLIFLVLLSGKAGIRTPQATGRRFYNQPFINDITPAWAI